MSNSVTDIVRRALGVVRLRQFTDRLRHRLSFVPGVYVLCSVVVVQVTLWFDRRLGSDDVPDLFQTTVDSARSILGAIAGGLITAITLVLSMMLVAVQLASSQFSPRTLRDWLGDSVLKHTIGIALGTTVFSLLALRSARSFGEDGREIVPHSSVAVAVLFAVISLFAVVRAVDHITHRLQIGSVADRLSQETISVIDASRGVRAGQNPRDVPSSGDPRDVDATGSDVDEIPDDAIAVEALASGWVQQIEVDTIFEHIPDASTGYVVAPLGGFVPAKSPLMWVSPPPDDIDACRVELLEAFALGDSRTLQQDVAFGLMQLTDIAVRAMSPGVNDPATAADIVVHLGDVMLALWAYPQDDAVVERDGRRLVRRPTEHGEHLSRAFDPIRRYARADPHVLSTIVRTLTMVRDEVRRRELPGPERPLTDMVDSVVASSDRTGWSPEESSELDRLARR